MEKTSWCDLVPWYFHGFHLTFHFCKAICCPGCWVVAPGHVSHSNGVPSTVHPTCTGTDPNTDLYKNTMGSPEKKMTMERVYSVPYADRRQASSEGTILWALTWNAQTKMWLELKWSQHVATPCIHGKLSIEDLHIYRDAKNTGCVKYCQLPQGVAYTNKLQAVCPMAI